MAVKREVIKGNLFGFLRVVSEGKKRVESNGREKRQINCYCLACGSFKTVLLDSLIKSKSPTTSCGCLSRMTFKEKRESFKKLEAYELIK